MVEIIKVIAESLLAIASAGAVLGGGYLFKNRRTVTVETEKLTAEAEAIATDTAFRVVAGIRAELDRMQLKLESTDERLTKAEERAALAQARAEKAEARADKAERAEQAMKSRLDALVRIVIAYRQRTEALTQVLRDANAPVPAWTPPSREEWDQGMGH